MHTPADHRAAALALLADAETRPLFSPARLALVAEAQLQATLALGAPTVSVAPPVVTAAPPAEEAPAPDAPRRRRAPKNSTPAG